MWWDFLLESDAASDLELLGTVLAVVVKYWNKEGKFLCEGGYFPS